MIERYTLPRMGKIWEPQYRFQKWLEVEIAVCEGMAKEGMIPSQAVETIKQKAAFSAERIDEIEKETKHDVIAFLTNLEENVGPEARYIHLGLTSSDILDTALALQLKEAMLIIIEDLQGLLDVLKDRAFEHKKTAMIGRSHGIHAEPITFGLKLALWYSEMKRNMKRLEQALEVISYGKISGAVGTFANVPPRIEEYACAQLGLKPAEISTQVVQRDRHAQYFTALGILAGSIEKIAVEIRHLQRTEVGEVEEAFTPGQKGSSAMPHKKNPIGSENLTGLARLVRAHCIAAMENIPLWHERDISHSSVERVIAPDSTILIDYMLNRLTRLIKNLVVYEDAMAINLDRLKGLIFSQQVLLALIAKECARQEAYSLTQRISLKAWNTGQSFKQLLLDDPAIRNYLNEAEIGELFSLDYHLKHVEEIFARVFQQ
ncbi:MAG: adenylosuccinate lyase [Deltaproteobacteria bacterium]|nr:adenylosuccinate lyase [Deltaproteobacteria bacterium]MBW2077596.1 adenylosuccinate lyase [Deltaproteobacteria bacterium]MBW2310552.1 adenylosuccinate lyase [Deltaproteobacteria bacterium]